MNQSSHTHCKHPLDFLVGKNLLNFFKLKQLFSADFSFGINFIKRFS